MTGETIKPICINLEERPSKTKEFILLKANEWNCSPKEASERIMDMIAENLTQEAA